MDGDTEADRSRLQRDHQSRKVFDLVLPLAQVAEGYRRWTSVGRSRRCCRVVAKPGIYGDLT